MQKMNLDTDLISLTKINSKLNIELKVKCETMKILGDNIEEYLDDPGIRMTFFPHLSRNFIHYAN